MVEVHGKPILRYTLENLRAAGILDISLVTGYRADAVRFPDIPFRTFHNPRFAETNMLASLFCAEEAMEGSEDVVVSYGDIVFETSVLRKLMADPGDISVVLDDGWLDQWKLRNEDPLKDAETLRLDGRGCIVEIGAEPTDYSQIESQYIGLLKFSPGGLALLRGLYHELERAVDGGEVIRGRSFPRLYFTDMLQLLADRHPGEVKGVRIERGWIEVDTAADYDLFNRVLPAKNRFCDFTGIPSAA
jgi:choline kinase